MIVSKLVFKLVLRVSRSSRCCVIVGIGFMWLSELPISEEKLMIWACCRVGVKFWLDTLRFVIICVNYDPRFSESRRLEEGFLGFVHCSFIHVCVRGLLLCAEWYKLDYEICDIISILSKYNLGLYISFSIKGSLCNESKRFCFVKVGENMISKDS